MASSSTLQSEQSTRGNASAGQEQVVTDVAGREVECVLRAKERRGTSFYLERWRRVDPGDLHEINRDEYLRLMAKAEANGVAALSLDERAFLDRFSGAPR